MPNDFLTKNKPVVYIVSDSWCDWMTKHKGANLRLWDGVRSYDIHYYTEKRKAINAAKKMAYNLSVQFIGDGNTGLTC